MTYPVPPKGFDPLTAPAAKLKEYGFPPKPTTPGALALWTSLVGKAAISPPPPVLAVNNMAKSTYAGQSKDSQNWSGYETFSPKCYILHLGHRELD